MCQYAWLIYRAHSRQQYGGAQQEGVTGDTAMFAKTMIAISAALALAPVFGASAQAQTASTAWTQDIEVGTALICDTQRQVERLVSLMHGDAQKALSAVNTEEKDPTACGMASLAFLRGSSLATIRTKDETFQIVEILVVGLVTQTGVRAVAPNIYISLFKVEERST